MKDAALAACCRFISRAGWLRLAQLRHAQRQSFVGKWSSVAGESANVLLVCLVDLLNGIRIGCQAAAHQLIPVDLPIV